MRFDFSLTPDPAEDAERLIRLAERGITRAMNKAQLQLKGRWRSLIAAGGLGRKLANTVRGETYPSAGESLNAASLVYVRPNRGTDASAATVVDAHERGALIRSSSGFYLAIPIAEIGKMRAAGNKRITPLGWEQKTGRRLRFVYRKGRPALLVDDGTSIERTISDPVSWKRAGRQRKARKTTPIFVLLPQAKLRPKFDLGRAAEAIAGQLPSIIAAEWKD
ncbi:DUF6441 family protein [Seohaeicola zhoushanensis]|uniref:Uncharacterized protein n=1 Tax=Seohaeicola zhoushanensis TaxID=1569283 RepID=A0A8J3H3C4_9RHOB|nr:DUF6441 family protein [Seohaeicola zhoushanensis]GHF71157.1 hypothetical protein GCM10017056_47590 [Seohaeicola zhoushanensis]